MSPSPLMKARGLILNFVVGCLGGYASMYGASTPSAKIAGTVASGLAAVLVSWLLRHRLARVRTPLHWILDSLLIGSAVAFVSGFFLMASVTVYVTAVDHATTFKNTHEFFEVMLALPFAGLTGVFIGFQRLIIPVLGPLLIWNTRRINRSAVAKQTD